MGPWIGKIIIDHVVLGQPIEDVTGYPSFLIPLIEMLEGVSVGGILSWVIAPFSRMLRRRVQAVLAAQSVLTSNIEEGMDNMLAVQALGAKKTERERFRRDSAESFRRIRYSQFALMAREDGRYRRFVELQTAAVD